MLLTLSSYSPEQKLDAEILLAHVLGTNRAYLHTHPEQVLNFAQQNQFNTLMDKCLLGEPVAYLTSSQAFWSLDLQVTPATLIPRPDTELLVESVLQIVNGMKMVIADLGTGSGAIALALAYELPDCEVYATDSSLDALIIAKANAKRLAINNVIFYQGNWCDALPKILFDIIVSNPPYIAVGDVFLSQSVYDYEPHAAIFSDNDGLRDIQHIITEATKYLKSGGYLLLEHGFQQAEEARKLFSKLGYMDIKTNTDLAGLDRVTMGRWH